MGFKTGGKILAFACIAAVMFLGCSRKMGSSESGGSGKGGVGNFYSPAAEDIVKDPETQLDVIKDVLNITFSRKMDEADILAVIASFKGEVVGQDKAARLYQVRFKVTDLAELDKLAKDILVTKGVELATKTSVSVHTNPYYVR